MELIIRFDENKVEDIKLARQALNRLEEGVVRNQLWDLLDQEITVLGMVNHKWIDRLQKAGIKLVGDMVTMSEKHPLLRHGKNPSRTSINSSNHYLQRLDPRLHLFMTMEETHNWSHPNQQE